MKYGVICAMEEEIQILKDALVDANEVDINGLVFYEGKINAVDVVLVRSGIGKVAAGITAAILISNFNIEAIIHSGSAGGIGAGLNIGDVVLSTAVAYHDVDATAFGYPYGQMPETASVFFEADKQLLDRVANASAHFNVQTKKGLIVTGDQFIADQDKVADILKHFPEALCCEMEGAAIGQVAVKLGVPFLVVRAISDTGSDSAEISFDEFIVDAGRRSAKVLIDLFKMEG